MMEMRLLVDDYINGRLDESQIEEFERAMKDDDELRRVVEYFQSIQLSADGLLEEDLLATVTTITDPLRSDSAKVKSKPAVKESKQHKPWLPILIGLLCISMLWIVFRPKTPELVPEEKSEQMLIEQPAEETEDIKEEKQIEEKVESKTEFEVTAKTTEDKPKEDQKKIDTKQLFAQHFSPYRHPSLEPTVRGAAEKTARDEFELAYWVEDYVEVLQQWNSLDELQQKNPTLQFLYVGALLDQRLLNEAEIILAELNKDKNRRFDETEDWYRALTLILSDQTDRGIEELNKISGQKNHAFNSNASEILLKIKTKQ